MTPEELQAQLDKLNSTAVTNGFVSAADMAAKVPSILAERQQATTNCDAFAVEITGLRERLQTASGSFGGEQQKAELLQAKVTDLEAQLVEAGKTVTTVAPIIPVKKVEDLTPAEVKHVNDSFARMDEAGRRAMGADPAAKTQFIADAIADTEALPAPTVLIGVTQTNQPEPSPYDRVRLTRDQGGRPLTGPGPSSRGVRRAPDTQETRRQLVG
jgi:hypothetical protein